MSVTETQLTTCLQEYDVRHAGLLLAQWVQQYYFALKLTPTQQVHLQECCHRIIERHSGLDMEALLEEATVCLHQVRNPLGQDIREVAVLAKANA
ncbi:hypothetical protein [Hymenobacter crusticola]|uniref:Uncharacterized protein n=1 Tax=Hymenobacter crusticola TaxID=1770526 RepID=A0A243W876_9BACT|nr:hypothetical protein [Hymenobacter crusticola]OUJ71364.1 hypothetical protein BXP70_21645 [Hymenobacter crusticola]